MGLTPLMDRFQANDQAGLSEAEASKRLVVYLVTWYGTQGQVTSQTVASFAWLINHILLASNTRSERQTIFQLGMGSNRMMLIWGVAAAVFILLITFIIRH